MRTRLGRREAYATALLSVGGVCGLSGSNRLGLSPQCSSSCSSNFLAQGGVTKGRCSSASRSWMSTELRISILDLQQENLVILWMLYGKNSL
jgi:hypothetical protein